MLFRSTTVRLNYDQTLTPTTLLHLGAGLLYTTQAVIPQRYDPATLGLIGYDTGAFPNFTGLSDATTGGNGIGIGVGAFGNYKQYEAKPTFNANLTLVRGNHTLKFGGEAMFDGIINDTRQRANGTRYTRIVIPAATNSGGTPVWLATSPPRRPSTG